MKFLIQPHVRLRMGGRRTRSTSARPGWTTSSSRRASLARRSARRPSGRPTDTHRGHQRRPRGHAGGHACNISAACHWAVNAAASVRGGRMWGRRTPSAVRDLRGPGVRLSSGPRPGERAGGGRVPSGSHYSAIEGLEQYLERPQIELSFIGLPYDRLRLALERRVLTAVNVFGAQVLRARAARVPQARGHDLHDGVPRERGRRHRRRGEVLHRATAAQQDIDFERGRYKHYWLREMPDDISASWMCGGSALVRRIVPGPYTREMFEQTHRWMRTWDLFDPWRRDASRLQGCRPDVTAQRPDAGSSSPVNRWRPAACLVRARGSFGAGERIIWYAAHWPGVMLDVRSGRRLAMGSARRKARGSRPARACGGHGGRGCLQPPGGCVLPVLGIQCAGHLGTGRPVRRHRSSRRASSR
mgnify:CR=1 FL=1